MHIHIIASFITEVTHTKNHFLIFLILFFCFPQKKKCFLLAVIIQVRFFLQASANYIFKSFSIQVNWTGFLRKLFCFIVIWRLIVDKANLNQTTSIVEQLLSYSENIIIWIILWSKCKLSYILDPIHFPYHWF